MKSAIFILVLLGNLWIWRIFSFSFALGFLVVITTIYLFRKTFFRENKNLFWLGLFFFLLALFQWRLTDKISLTKLDNDQQRIQAMRLREYPPVHLDIFGKTVWIPVAHWFEGRSETIAFFRILNNFSESVDPNLYFFASHPRERVGIKEFEKFPYLLLPFFVLGTIFLIKEKKKRTPLLISFVPLILLSIIRNKSSLGPFSLFPFILTSTTFGLSEAYKKIGSWPKLHKRLLVSGFLILYLFTLLQMIAYEMA